MCLWVPWKPGVRGLRFGSTQSRPVSMHVTRLQSLFGPHSKDWLPVSFLQSLFHPHFKDWLPVSFLQSLFSPHFKDWLPIARLRSLQTCLIKYCHSYSPSSGSPYIYKSAMLERKVWMRRCGKWSWWNVRWCTCGGGVTAWFQYESRMSRPAAFCHNLWLCCLSAVYHSALKKVSKKLQNFAGKIWKLIKKSYLCTPIWKTGGWWGWEFFKRLAQKSSWKDFFWKKFRKSLEVWK